VRWYGQSGLRQEPLRQKLLRQECQECQEPLRQEPRCQECQEPLRQEPRCQERRRA
jgi:predicted amidophosphoribosyltransferase